MERKRRMARRGERRGRAVLLAGALVLAGCSCDCDMEPPGMPEAQMPAEPTVTVVAPPPGAMVGGLVALTAQVADRQGDPARLTWVLTADSGLTYQPATLRRTSAGVLEPYTPTDPDAGPVGAANQVTGVPPGSVTVDWDPAADGLGLTGPEAVTLRVYAEDGTTAGAGPFGRGEVPLTVDSTGVPACVIRSGGMAWEERVSVEISATDEDGDLLEIRTEFSLDGGVTFAPCTPASFSPLANPATGIPPAPMLQFVWEAPVDVSAAVRPVTALVQVLLDDGSGGPGGRCEGEFTLVLPEEPTCEILAPAAGDTAGGVVTLTVQMADVPGRPVELSTAYSIDGGITWLAPALASTSAGFISPYPPTRPDVPVVGLFSQVTQVFAPPDGAAVHLTWNTFAAGLGLGGSPQEVRFLILPEDGSSGGEGPFHSCEVTFLVSN